MLHLSNVRKSFVEPGGGRLPILDIGEFKLAEGEECVLVGGSGSGKTTLLHIIAGISSPDSGQVLLAGTDMVKLPEAARDRLRAEKIGYVFQTFNLLPGFSALENVLLGMTFGRQAANPARAKELLERVGLGHRLHHFPSTMSVGEQQRVAVARALANKPRLLLADEPTANVDRKNQQNVIDQIRKNCQEDRVALLLVTHASEVADQFARVEKLETFNRAAGAL